MAIHCNLDTPFCAVWYLNFVKLITDIALVAHSSRSRVSAIFVAVTIGVLVNVIGKLIKSSNILVERIHRFIVGRIVAYYGINNIRALSGALYLLN